jgi:hypothetical protein
MLRLQIDTRGAAFEGDGALEVAGILRHMADQVESGLLDGVVIDRNGNSCGLWDLRFERSQAEGDDA